MITKELQDKLQDLANKLQEHLVTRYGDGQVTILSLPNNQFQVNMLAQGVGQDSYLIYQNDIDKNYYFIRNWNGVR